jgi:cGMP-specific 3',5'-cyclic phosphodiesterase
MLKSIKNSEHLQIHVISQSETPLEVLFRWVMTVKKNYRKVTYHNWRHAFNVAQTMFAMLKCGAMEFGDTEKLSLLVACFCHDLDHRGTNNAFQSEVESAIAQLYSTSTMDHSIISTIPS